MKQEMQNLKLFYYIYLDALMGLSGNSPVVKKAARRYTQICESLNNWRTPSLVHQTDKRWMEY